jgi:hypothetical protein
MIKAIQNKNIDIEYVYIEMVLNQEDKYEVISGLLQGIKTKEGSTFILLHGKKDITNIINLKFYNVMTIEVLHKDHKDMTFLNSSADDQKLALGILNKVYEELLKNNFALEKDEDLINILNYINVPEEYYKGTITKSKENNSIQSKSTHTQCNGVGNFANSDANKSLHTPNKKKELVPSIFNRTKSKRPSKASLDLMQKKIDQINLGEFKCDLPYTLGNPDEKTNDKDALNLYENSLDWAH